MEADAADEGTDAAAGVAHTGTGMQTQSKELATDAEAQICSSLFFFSLPPSFNCFTWFQLQGSLLSTHEVIYSHYRLR